MLGFSSHTLYLALLGLLIVERLVELVVSKRNERSLVAQGAAEHGRGHYGVMVAFHTLFLVACPAEVLLLDRPFVPWLGATMLVALLAAQALRYWAISSLGGRWTTRIFVLPAAPPVAGGPYRWVRHPNYVAVIVEMFALPLIHTAWLTALVATLGNAWLLRTRILAEEAALSSANRYQDVFADRPRFLPRTHG